ncbi:A-kinase anchor protein 4-like [Hemicordylus capensis]|uniref:A-kinase anchor protein 4-like n=1 Tax=Hemicordylus capensis TaxID=884348 RepID=UPI002303F5F3|nr:A-kinase anchor protein 4-like [Hemicordylus capensis]
MAAMKWKDDSELDCLLQTTKMVQDIDWLHCRASLCKVSLYTQDQLRGSKDRKLVCFVDVSSLNATDRDSNPLPCSSRYGETDPPEAFDLEEKEIIVMKDESKNTLNTEGAVCFFKASPCRKGNVGTWLSSDLQKYAAGFQHALTPSNAPPKSLLSDSAGADKTPLSSFPAFNCSGGA